MYLCYMIVKETIYKSSYSEQSFSNEVDAIKHENNVLTNKVSDLKNQIENLKKSQPQLRAGDKMMRGKILPSERQEELLHIPETSGIYLIVNKSDNYKKYVGSAKFLRTRINNFFNFNLDYGGGAKLKEAREKYNHASHWTVIILEFCDISALEERENFFIGVLDTIKTGYNVGNARRNPTKDLVNVSQDCDPELLKKYKIFIGLYALDVILCPDSLHRSTTKEKQKAITYTQFAEAYKKLGIGSTPGNSCFTLKIKYVRNGEVKNIDDLAKYLSIIPTPIAKIINSAKSIYTNKEGLPCNTIKEIYDLGYMFTFSCLYSGKYGIPTMRGGFKTKLDAYASLLETKTNTCRRLADEYRNLIDEETYNILKTLTYKEADRLFFDLDKPKVNLSDEIIPDMLYDSHNQIETECGS